MMPARPQFEELDYRETPLGGLSLRRKTVFSLENREVYEILLGHEFLMSSLFTEVEIALARLGLAATTESFPEGKLDVAVGGLGLGYTARAALENPAVRSLAVVDFLQAVIEWHREGLVPLGPELTADRRCRFVHGDFFELDFEPDHIYHALLLDIDHSPSKLLHERHSSFYNPEGLRRLAGRLHPGGVFALWSDDPPDEAFMSSLREVFPSCESHTVPFHNPLQERECSSTVYVAKTHAG